MAALCLVLGLGKTPVGAQTTPAQPAPAEAKPANPPEDPVYVLQRGDEIELRAVNIAELNQLAKIRPDGRISVLLLNDVEAAGLTPVQLGEKLNEAYAKHYRNPRITVVVRNFVNQAVFVGGEVTTPRIVPLNGRMTLAGAIIFVGGAKNTAKLKDVVLLRNSGGQPTIRKLNVEDIFKKGKPDPELKPFDVVYVPRTRIANLNRFVEQYIKNMLPMNTALGFSYVLNQQPLIQ